MSAPLEELPRASLGPAPSARSSGPAGPLIERRQRSRRQSDRDWEKSNRRLAVGNFILSAVLVLTVLVGLGMILKGCADFGSPFVTESGGFLRTR